MPFDMRLWKANGANLEPLESAELNQEERLEEWISRDPSILGMELAIFGRQVVTINNGRIDLLALDRDANCVIIELKKGRTPREVIAQLLDYASWVVDLNFDELENIARRYDGNSLTAAYERVFGAPLPETVNTSHHMVLVASQLDASSERIIGYLAEQHEVGINAVFFTFFADGDKELLGRAWLRDPIETVERAENKKRRPWSGYWFVNVGDGAHRNWDDNRQYGYIGAGGGEKYARALQNLKAGDKIFAYMKGLGYVGYGQITKEAVPVEDFVVEPLRKPILDLPLKAPKAGDRSGTDRSEWAVGVNWIKTVGREEAKTFKGVFANQNIVCKLRDQATVEFLTRSFGLNGAEG
jgi:hypothetical protein